MNKKTEWKRLRASWDRDEPAYTLRLARDFLTKWPDHPVAWIILGNTLTSLGRYPEARQALSKSIRYCPPERRAYAFIQMGHVFHEKGAYRIAERWYRKAVSCDKDTINFVFLGGCLAKQGRFAEAKRCHRQAINIASDPTDEAYYNLGLILRAEEKHDEALAAFKEALKIDPKYREAKIAIRDLEKHKKHKSVGQ